MRVALETGEVLDVALIEDGRIVANLSLQLKSGNTSRLTARATSTGASAEGGNARGRGRRKRVLSPEAREKMRQAQLRRWAKTRGEGGQ
jgi:hypothetical protein